jgi:hypothetical protein
MADRDDVLTAFKAAHPDGHIIVTGRPGARYLMSIEATLTTFMADGEPDTPDFMNVFAQALRTGRFVGIVTVLVDLIRFTGAVDWGAVKALHDRIDWKAVGILKIAYLVRDMHFAPFAKIAGAIISEGEHVVFDDKRLALAWLAATV